MLSYFFCCFFSFLIYKKLFIYFLDSEDVRIVSRKYLYTLLKQSTKASMEDKFLFLENKLIKITKCTEQKRKTLKKILSHFKCDFKRKWEAANRKEERFLKNNQKWINASIKLPMWKKINAGRPRKDFIEVSDRSKRRKTNDLREQITAEELTYAAQMSQRAAGNIDASTIIKNVTSSPTRATKFRNVMANVKTNIIQKHLPSQALAIFVEADLSRRQWEIIHSANKKTYPCYSLIKKAKQQCYPKAESIYVTKTCAEIRLQDLLDHTTLRLCKYLEEVFEKFTEIEKLNLELLTKWGCVGFKISAI